MAGGHGVDQRAIGHVDGGITYGQEQIGSERPGDFDPHAGVRNGKGQNADNPDGNRHPQLPGTKTPPAALRAVGNNPHHRIGNGVKHAQRNKQCPHQRGGQAKNVGMEKGKKIHN